MATFSQRLSSLRKSYDLTQEQLAKSLNITRSRLAMYEQGKREPDFELQELIADYFNVDLDYLLGRKEKAHSIPIYDPDIQEWAMLLPRLTPDQKASLLNTARLFVQTNESK